MLIRGQGNRSKCTILDNIMQIDGMIINKETVLVEIYYTNNFILKNDNANKEE